MEREITLTVNGEPRTWKTDPERTLLEALREDFNLTGTKYSCGEGQCRACTVLVDDRPVMSCITPLAKAEGKSIVTIEGLAENGQLHPVQEAFLSEGAMQCGYCTPGMILQTVALLRHKPEPSDDDIVEWLNGNICRCCGYTAIRQAVHRAAAALREAPAHETV